MKRTGRRNGFTMLELLATIAIIFTLAGLLLAGATMAKRAALNRKTGAAIEELAAASESYYKDYRDFPFPDPASLGFNSTSTPAFHAAYYSGGWTYEGIDIVLVWMLSKPRQPAPYISLDHRWFEKVDGCVGPDGRDLYVCKDGFDQYIRVIRPEQYYKNRTYIEFISAGDDGDFGTTEDNIGKYIKR